MSYLRGVEKLREHNRQVEKRRKEKKLLASIIGRQGTEYRDRKSNERSWFPNDIEKQSPLKRWWNTLTSHLSPTRRGKCMTCDGRGLVGARICSYCKGKGWVRVPKGEEARA
jgi:DnaJ-class molecular chaperone